MGQIDPERTFKIGHMNGRKAPTRGRSNQSGLRSSGNASSDEAGGAFLILPARQGPELKVELAHMFGWGVEARRACSRSHASGRCRGD